MKAVHFEIFPKLCINDVLVFVVFVEIHQNGYWISRDCPSSRSDSETVFFCFISPIWKQRKVFFEIRTCFFLPTIRTDENDSVLEFLL